MYLYLLKCKKNKNGPFEATECVNKITYVALVLILSDFFCFAWPLRTVVTCRASFDNQRPSHELLVPDFPKFSKLLKSVLTIGLAEDNNFC